MPTRETMNGLARGLTSGALLLTVFSWGGSALPASTARPALAEEIDCYNDKDLFDLPECVERRANDAKTGNQPSSNTSSPLFAPTSSSGDGPPSNNQSQPAGDPAPPQANNPPPPQPQQQSQQQAQPQNEEEPEEKPRGPATDPSQVILTLADAGKEATQFRNDTGTDKSGRWAWTRFERDRTTAASTLGPNVMDSHVWIAKDVETAKALFKEQAAIKDFPERKENVQGPNEKGKPQKFGEEFSFQTGYHMDPDNKTFQHYRFTIRQGAVVAVLYLFGREDFFLEPKEKSWTGQGDWFTKMLWERM